MFIVLSKLIEPVLLPSNFIAILGTLGVIALVFRWKRVSLWLLGTSTVLLCIAGYSPLGPVLVMSLEDRFAVPELPGSVTGIVMLGGAEEAHITTERNNITLNDNAERIFETAMLARRYPHARIILSGGGGHLVIGEIQTEAEISQRVLVGLGISPERIEMERRSRTTFENAVQSVAIAKPQTSDNWLLVTSAYNMPRAVASFRAVGFPTTPYPVDYRTRPSEFWRSVSDIADGLIISDIAGHEWLGLAAYRLSGKTKSFLPSAE